MRTTYLRLAEVAVLSVSAADAQVVFVDDFTSSSVANISPGYIGGWFTPQMAFEQWIGVPAEASISSGQLNVALTTAGRDGGAFLVLAPDKFSSAGTVDLSYVISAFTPGDARNLGLVRVWTGSGFDFGNTPNSLQIRPEFADVIPSGAASATLVAQATVSGTGPAKLLFNRSEGDAVAIFFGWDAVSSPWPSMSVGSMSVSIVPEPHEYAALVGFGLLGFAAWRRTRRA